MARLASNDILSAIALGKRANNPIELKEVKVQASPLKTGDPTYDFNGKVVSHSAILNAVPSSQRDAVGKYLSTFRILKSATEKAGSPAATMTNQYVLNGAATKNDTYDMVKKIAQSIK